MQNSTKMTKKTGFKTVRNLKILILVSYYITAQMEKQKDELEGKSKEEIQKLVCKKVDNQFAVS